MQGESKTLLTTETTLSSHLVEQTLQFQQCNAMTSHHTLYANNNMAIELE